MRFIVSRSEIDLKHEVLMAILKLYVTRSAYIDQQDVV
jgi:hypothetical protein